MIDIIICWYQSCLSREINDYDKSWYVQWIETSQLTTHIRFLHLVSLKPANDSFWFGKCRSISGFQTYPDQKKKKSLIRSYLKPNIQNETFNLHLCPGDCRPSGSQTLSEWFAPLLLYRIEKPRQGQLPERPPVSCSECISCWLWIQIETVTQIKLQCIFRLKQLNCQSSEAQYFGCGNKRGHSIH